MAVRRGLEILREEDLLTLLHRGSVYVFRPVSRPLFRRYFLTRGKRTVSLGEKSATFIQADRRDFAFVWYFNKHEAEMASCFLSDVEEGDTVFDVGAHIGYYSCFLGQIAGDVVAFEPDPQAVERLRRNISFNNLSDRVEIIEAAVSIDSGRIPFGNPALSQPIGSGMASINPGSEDDTLEVETVCIDQLVEDGQVEEPNAIKIDVEGAEGLVLEGMQKTLRSGDCRVVFCEIHTESPNRRSITDYGYTESDIFSMLKESGFTTEVVNTRGPDVHVRGVK